MAIALKQTGRASSVLSVAMLVAGLSFTASAADRAGDAPYVQIDTEAFVERMPDVAVVTLGITGDASDGETALALHSRNLLNILAAMREVGVAAKDIVQERPLVAPFYESWVEKGHLHTGRRLGFRATTRMILTLRDMQRAGGIVQTLVHAGVTYIDSIKFQLNDERQAAARAHARAEAIAQAGRLAMRSARETGATGIRLVSAREPPPPDGAADLYVPPELRETGPMPVIEPGTIEITEKIRATFLLIP